MGVSQSSQPLLVVALAAGGSLAWWYASRREVRVDRSRIPPGLVRALRNGECFLFVGAGFSANAGSKTFVPLLRALCKQTPEDDTKPPDARYSANELRALTDGELWNMSNHELDEVQFDLCRVLGYHHMCQLLKSELLWTSPQTINDIYDRQRNALLNLKFAAAATWNWDNLLDSGLEEKPLPHDVHAVAHSRCLFKLNGSLSAEEGDPLAAVFSRDAYRAMEETRQRFTMQVGQQSSILTVGLRMESEETPYNPLGKRWWGPRGSAACSSREHYVILPEPLPGSRGLEDEQRIRDMEATYNAKVITFKFRDNHGNKIEPAVGLAELLERINKEVEYGR